MQDTSNNEMPRVKNFMTSKVITFTPDQDLGLVLKVFNEKRISSAPVIKDADSKDVVGFITEDDVMRELASSSFFAEPFLTSVGKAMSKDVISLNPEMDVFEVENLLREKNLRQAPVVDEHQHQIGIVTRRDVMRALEKHMESFRKNKVYGRPHLSMMNEAQWRLQTR